MAILPQNVKPWTVNIGVLLQSGIIQVFVSILIVIRYLITALDMEASVFPMEQLRKLWKHHLLVNSAIFKTRFFSFFLLTHANFKKSCFGWQIY